jgi:hypothetical protein
MEMPRFERRLWKPIFWLVVAGLLLSVSVVVAGPGPHGPKDAEDFVGLWQGIDPLDGSPVRLSLSDVEGDGVIEHTMHEDFFSVCFALGPGYPKGRGVITGTATVASKTILEAKTVLTCISDTNVPFPTGPASVQQYTLRSHGLILVLPEFGSSPGIVLHRVAQ